MQERGRAAGLSPVHRRPRAVREVEEVGHEDYRGTAVVEVTRLVPPLCQPARVLAVLGTSDQSSLQLAALLRARGWKGGV